MKKNTPIPQIDLQGKYHLAIVVSNYYEQISQNLLAGIQWFMKSYPNVSYEVFYVAGSFELPIVCKKKLQSQNFDAAIALGVVVQGETRHFDYVCTGVTSGIMQVMLETEKIIGFGVLTVNNLEQAQARSQAIPTKASVKELAGVSNKGIETSFSVLKALKALETKSGKI